MSLNVILPSAFSGIRKNSNKPKICVEFEDFEPLYQKQIDTIRKVYPTAKIVYVLGFNADKVDYKLEQLKCNVVYNYQYQTTNVAYSISLALQLISAPSLIIYGDLYFTSDLLRDLPKKSHNSYLLQDKKHSFHKKNIGIGPNKIMDFCFEDKWSQIMYLNKQDAQDFCEISLNPRNIRKFTYEVINEMQQNKTIFDIVNSPFYIREIDRVKELNEINNDIFGDK